MDIRDIRNAYNEIAAERKCQKCFRVELDYVDNGTKEKYTFQVVDGSKIELIMEATRTPQQIAKLALEPAVI
jgi:hypothetical protein